MANLVEHIDRSRWRPAAVLGSGGPLVDRLRSSGLRVDIVAMSQMLASIKQGEIRARSFHPLRLLSSVAYVLALASTFMKMKARIVHANSWRACVLGGIAARLVKTPCIWHLHSVAAEPMMSPAGVRLLTMLARWLPAHIICNSEATAAPFGASVRHLSIVPCGVEAYDLRPNAHQDGVQRIGMISRFAPIKGQHVFLQAAHQVGQRNRSAQFVLAGTALFREDAYEAGLREDAKLPDLAGRVEMIGFVADVPTLLQTLDVVVSPSISPEGFGQIVVEAMMCGKPVIASAGGAVNELIEDGITGRLVPPGDPVALADAINDVLAHPDESAEMGRRARVVALERYDIRKTTRAIEAVYEKVLARN
jgi:glycosyltransferase involved in cell wall biosynthesis